ncbi:MAG: class I tRNA ligase family protein, partial [Clostridia bacterium]|nr:class I tRNA ligase family protein [Clostridia bacterium]
MAQDYNSTINLPKTEFAMRAALPQREPGFLKEWEEKEVYKLMLEKNADKPKFILHDGPPFSNGNIHMGHALNKSLKDFMNRHKAMDGYQTPYVPGWDNHGMPIESAIIKKNKIDQKNMSAAEFRSACQEFAQNFVDIQMEQFKRLGVLADWEHPYLTMDPGFEAEEVKVFGAMYKKGYIYKGLKPVYWCTHDETALAEAEIEYKDEPCASIFVKFALKNDLGKMGKYGDITKMNFIIWTTTTWTLPGNLAIALNPVESYVLIKAANGEMYIVAEALAETTMKTGGIDSYEIVDRFDGNFFEYMTAQHPFLDRDSLLVLADYVTMEDGTGCVHTAPGFGAEDNITGRKYNLPLLVPVDDRGYQTEDAGMFAGMRFDESNDAILKHLKETGALFASKEIVHSYPHCWRCKNPIIFRATPQWFCSVDAFKDAACEACDPVRWLPAWGIDRMKSMIRERNDW